MKKVITYGTYDMLHYGHIRLLERAKALGDYLIVGVTADDYDKSRGKINVQQSLSERIEAVKETGIADEVIVEEYEGQKIDDIQKYGIDIFTVGSDWRGVFDYLSEYCKVIYLDRTMGISSSELREQKNSLNLGLAGKHVLCESPLALSRAECEELIVLAEEKNCILIETLRTVYSTAFHRLMLLIKSGKIGDVVSVDAVCTSMKDSEKLNKKELDFVWGSFAALGPTALLPIFQLLGTGYVDFDMSARFIDVEKNFDVFSKIAFVFPKAVASIKVGNGIKSENELIISGTKGYVYVPAPWWKTDYFELRYENPNDNRRYFYQLDGEGIRSELVSFVRSIKNGQPDLYISRDISATISELMELYYIKKSRKEI